MTWKPWQQIWLRWYRRATQAPIDELIAAIARGGNAGKIADAQAAMADAAAFTAAGLYNEAVNAYKTAWDAATKA